MLLFDIGANRGDATLAGLQKGYSVIACEPAPKVFAELVKNFIYSRGVTPLRMAVSDKDNERIEFYEADEDGLSTINRDWLTSETMPYAGKSFRTIQANTITIDTLAKIYGEPDLIKIDVEGAEWSVLRGMTKRYGTVAMEWTFETLAEHEAQMDYMFSLGYRSVAPQYIVHHLEQPTDWYELQNNNDKQMLMWHQTTSDEWIESGWRVAGLRPTADVGMLWFR
jgi:FkbM family methyltransferase